MKLALKLSEVCPHCGQHLEVVFVKDAATGVLKAGFKHGMFDVGEMRPIKGFDDLVALPEGVSSES